MTELKKDKYFAPGHNGCPGCGIPIGVRAILQTIGKDVIVVTPTGCLETISSMYEYSSWEVPWIHPLFENAPAVASGVKRALKYKNNESTEVVVIGGDGATYDIGMGALSGMFEREDKILYVCYDNEAYMNTGIQRSSATPFGAETTTTPTGKYSFGERQKKKSLVNIALSHGLNFVATASIAYIKDLKEKVREALNCNGPSFIEMITPCNLGWEFEPEKTIEIARLAVETGLFPLLKYKEGELVDSKGIKNIKAVEKYLEKQGRFDHLMDEEWEEALKNVKKLASENIEKFNLH